MKKERKRTITIVLIALLSLLGGGFLIAFVFGWGVVSTIIAVVVLLCLLLLVPAVIYRSPNIFRAIATIIAVGILSLFCFVLILGLSFAEADFYVGVVVGVYFFLLLLIPCTIFRAFGRKTILICWISVLAVPAAAAGIHEAIAAYRGHLDWFYDNSTEGYYTYYTEEERYKPFEGSLLAKPVEAPALSLSDDLPRLSGARMFYPIYAAVAEAVYPKKDYSLDDSEVSYSTLQNSYRALKESRADIIFVTEPSEGWLRESGYFDEGFVFTPIGREAFVFFVNARNPVSSLTTGQLKDIYSGRVKNWKNVGGKPGKIKVYRGKYHGLNHAALLDLMDGREMIEGVKDGEYYNYRNAIGYCYLYYFRTWEPWQGTDNVKLLSIDGVYPDLRSISSMEYPLTRNICAVTRAGETKPNVARLIEWILSPQGQHLIEAVGYSPLPVSAQHVR